MIEISGVSKSYDGRPVVRDVTATIPAGGITSIIGPNGAGKSTLLSMISRFPHNGGRPTATDKEHIDASLDYLELGPLADRFVDELSGGQRQRAFIAMVLAQDTEYLLLDEPLNNLDMKHSVHMMRTLRKMADELGKTIVLVIHDINFASCYSDTILAMKDGELISQGAPAELMHSSVLAQVYGIDIRVEEIDGNRIGVYFA
ncbi:iron ABC transporter ATP-binding protein [Arthrobacter sp. AQ5-05]|uniref:iron ABC transporter ATP-binding protein n=1 Tax=Arthrobacter sp. AQ5-05 TaxID=2184581 RepID=UPI0012B64B37|nr:ATP-binding cassette domain-containing protein [Arthrobacter sp. AQ5-05]